MGRLLQGSAGLAALIVACGGGQSSGQGTDASIDASADGAGAGAGNDADDASAMGDGASDGGFEANPDAATEASMAEAGTDAADEASDAGSLSCPGDMYEPNDTQVAAYPLGSIDECDTSGSTLTAVSSGSADEDWYHYSGTSTVTCTADPTTTIDATGLETCIFVICASGTTTISSCTNGSPSMSAAGTPGCCTTSTTSMTAQMSCSSTTNAADVYMRVRQPSSNLCVSYDLAYHF